QVECRHGRDRPEIRLGNGVRIHVAQVTVVPRRSFLRHAKQVAQPVLPLPTDPVRGPAQARDVLGEDVHEPRDVSLPDVMVALHLDAPPVDSGSLVKSEPGAYAGPVVSDTRTSFPIWRPGRRRTGCRRTGPSPRTADRG